MLPLSRMAVYGRLADKSIPHLYFLKKPGGKYEDMVALNSSVVRFNGSKMDLSKKVLLYTSMYKAGQNTKHLFGWWSAQVKHS